MTRAALDAYYTPDEVALRCTRWLARRIQPPRTLLEPSVGGGAWVRAALAVWPNVLVDAVDVDPRALGLTDRRLCSARVGDWLQVAPRPSGWDLILGNPPYAGVDAHVAHALRHADTVALLLRETITGGEARYRNLWRLRRPAWIGKLPGRVAWEGGSAHDSPDTVGHVLVVWDGPTTETRWDWIVEDEDEQVGLW